jgi:hypothetical protein
VGRESTPSTEPTRARRRKAPQRVGISPPPPPPPWHDLSQVCARAEGGGSQCDCRVADVGCEGSHAHNLAPPPPPPAPPTHVSRWDGGKGCVCRVADAGTHKLAPPAPLQPTHVADLLIPQIHTVQSPRQNLYVPQADGHAGASQGVPRVPCVSLRRGRGGGGGHGSVQQGDKRMERAPMAEGACAHIDQRMEVRDGWGGVCTGTRVSV